MIGTGWEESHHYGERKSKERDQLIELGELQRRGIWALRSDVLHTKPILKVLVVCIVYTYVPSPGGPLADWLQMSGAEILRLLCTKVKL